jgi:succinoglycan biosynthesis transport protein ExoP
LTLTEFREEGPSSLQDYLQILRRRKWLILQAVIVIPVAAMLWAERAPTHYHASADVLMNPQNLAANVEGVQDPTQTNTVRFVESQIAVAQVPEVARSALNSLGLRNWSPLDLLDESNVTASPDTSDVLTFIVNDAKRSRAIQLVNAYASSFTRYRLKLDTSAIANARDSVRARLRQLEAQGLKHSRLYANLVQTEQRLATLASLQTSRAVLVRRATGAATIGPKWRKDALFGLALGLIIGIGLAFLREALDTRARSAEIVAREIGLPLLGRIPEPPPRVRRMEQLVTLAEPHGPHAEAFRMLASNIELMNTRHGARTILLTSGIEQEGKSTTAANLAVALARTGRRVALVDFDPYNNGLVRFFKAVRRLGSPPSPGLSELIAGDVSIETVATHIDAGAGTSWIPQPNGDRPLRGSLEVIPFGAEPPPPGAFDSDMFAHALDLLKERYDLVLIDAPPLLRTADALTASSFVDALILVVRLGFIHRAALPDLRRVLESCPARKIGFVATGADADAPAGYLLSYPYLSQQRVSAPLDAEN